MALQAQRWVSPSQCGPDGTAGVTCTVLTFYSRGTYRWTTLSDSSPVVREGAYEALCFGEGIGLLTLGDETALSFELQPQRLLLSGLELVGRAKRGDNATSVGANERSASLPDRFCALADGPWRKANSFDIDALPDRMTFGTDGRARFEYRAGACDHELRWGVLEGQLRAGEQGNACDLRQTAPQNRKYDWPIEIDDRGVLQLAAEYRRERNVRTTELITLRTTAIALSLELDGRLRSGATVGYRGRLERRGGGDAVTVQAVRATLTAIVMRDGGAFDVTGVSQNLFEQHLDTALTANAPIEFQGQLTTAAMGAVVVLIELLYSSGGRELEAERSLVGSLDP
jgi:hypothetical protein